jgi:hypothetical protein
LDENARCHICFKLPEYHISASSNFDSNRANYASKSKYNELDFPLCESGEIYSQIGSQSQESANSLQTLVKKFVRTKIENDLDWFEKMEIEKESFFDKDINTNTCSLKSLRRKFTSAATGEGITSGSNLSIMTDEKRQESVKKQNIC